MGIIQSYCHDKKPHVTRHRYEDGVPHEFMGLYDLSHLFPKNSSSKIAGSGQRGVKKRKLSADISVTTENQEIFATEAAVKQFFLALQELTMASDQLNHFFSILRL